MRPYFALGLLLLGFLLPTLSAYAVEEDPGLLHVGEEFPQFSGQTLTGKRLQFPAATAGARAVIVFSFSKAAGNDARVWNEHIANDFAHSVPVYTVILLESVPKLFRGMVLSGIQNNMPPAIQDRTVVSYREEELWKRRLAVIKEDRAYVVLVGADGRILRIDSASFSEAGYLSLKNTITGHSRGAKSNPTP